MDQVSGKVPQCRPTISHGFLRWRKEPNTVAAPCGVLCNTETRRTSISPSQTLAVRLLIPLGKTLVSPDNAFVPLTTTEFQQVLTR
jgi:hypothetical protein